MTSCNMIDLRHPCSLETGHAGWHDADGRRMWRDVDAANLRIVAGCADCPCVERALCTLAIKANLPNVQVQSQGPPPAWCPLRSRSLVLRLAGSLSAEPTP